MKKHNIAILGFGVVGGGVAKLVTENREELKRYLNREIVIKKILDLRDFPNSPFGSLVTHDFNDILNDSDIDTVIEVMGGSHPAYEFTIAALKAGKNVITSNKEVVANYGSEFLSVAREYGVSYRFEAAVGGGIPVIAPILSSVKQNKITEIRGILNGTTNYILTKMFTYGDSFPSALKDAQEKGYAERNPDADILGGDACRKIAILCAIATGRMFSVDNIPTEGISGIRKEDVALAESIGCKIKLLGRCILDDGKEPYIMVAPFLLPAGSPLSEVNGVYNAVEVVAEPLGNVMFYGQGAGAGATASAVVSDLAPVIAYGGNDALAPRFASDDYSPKSSHGSFMCRNYVAVSLSSLDEAKAMFGDANIIEGENEYGIVTSPISEADMQTKLDKLGDKVLSRIRFL